MTEPTAPPAPVPGLFSRAIAVIVAPRPLFEKLVLSPKVIGALLAVGVVIGLSQGLPQLTATGRQAALDAQVQQTERFTGRAVTEEQYAQMQRFAPLRAYATLIFAPAGVALMTLIMGGVFYVIFNVVLGGTATYKQMLTVLAHSGFISALGAVLGAVVQHFQGVLTPTGPFTLAALAPTLDESTFLARMLSFINVFSIWGTIVTAIGLSVLYRRKTTNIAIGLLTLMVLVSAGFAAVFGLFSGR